MPLTEVTPATVPAIKASQTDSDMFYPIQKTADRSLGGSEIDVVFLADLKLLIGFGINATN